MAHLDRLSGNEAVAVAMRQINPDVMGAFPITPSTEIPQYFAQYVADGKVDTELVTVVDECTGCRTANFAFMQDARANERATDKLTDIANASSIQSAIGNGYVEVNRRFVVLLFVIVPMAIFFG